MKAPAVEVDVLVVGGGPAGIAAAARAADAGATVAVVDAGMHPGGQIWRHGHDPAGLPGSARRWLDRCRRSGVRWIPLATAVDVAGECQLAVVTAAGVLTATARAMVIATGARELFLPFPGWTLPNVLGAGGGQALLKGGLDVRGHRVVVAGSGPLLLPVAAAMRDAGATLVSVAEQAPVGRIVGFASSLWAHPAKLARAARYGGRIRPGRYRTGTWVVRARGDGVLRSVVLGDGRREWEVGCDLLCCSYGLVPATELAHLLGCEIARGRVTVDELQRTTVPDVYCAGETTGVAGDAAAIAEGEIAGLAAAGATDAARAPRLRRARARGRAFGERIEAAFAPRTEVLGLWTSETILCRCEDVQFGDLDAAWSGRQAKLYTRVGMGPCQGAICGPAARCIFGWQPDTVRPPLFAPSLSSWVGALSDVTGGES